MNLTSLTFQVYVYVYSGHAHIWSVVDKQEMAELSLEKQAQYYIVDKLCDIILTNRSVLEVQNIVRWLKVVVNIHHQGNYVYKYLLVQR